MAVARLLLRVPERGPHIDQNGNLAPYVLRILNEFAEVLDSNSLELVGQVETVEAANALTQSEVNTIVDTPVLTTAASAAARLG